MDEMELLLVKQQRIRECCAHIFEETCLHHNFLD